MTGIASDKPDLIFVLLQETEFYSNNALQLFLKDKNRIGIPVFLFFLFNDIGRSTVAC